MTNHEISTFLPSGGGGSDDDTDDGTTTSSGDIADDDSGSGGGGGGDDGGGVFTLPSVLSSFADQPRNFILGAIGSTIVAGILDITVTLVDVLLLAFGGSQPFSFSETEARWGLADLPFLVAGALTDAGATIGTDIIQAATAINDPLFAAADTAGPLAPLLVATVIAAEAGIIIVAGSTIVRVTIDAIPGGGGLIR